MNTSLKRIIVCVAAFTVSARIYAAPPAVTNVTAQQREGTKLVDITYDLAAAASCRVSVRISTNGGLSYTLVPAPGTLSGDAGVDIAAGTGKSIVWDMSKQYDWQYNANMRIKVIAEAGLSGGELPGSVEFKTVPSGSFLLGRESSEGSGGSDEQPTTTVYVGEFEISQCEVTNAQYAEFLRAAYAANEIYISSGKVYSSANSQPCYYLRSGSNYGRIAHDGGGVFTVENGRENHPANYVSWYGGIAFCQFYTTEGVIYDLPTEAEWEKAARGPDHGAAGTHQIYPWANSIDGSNANYDSSGDPYDDGTTPVGYYNGDQYPSGNDMVNGYGLYDMAGNLWEWCRSGYASYPYEDVDSLEIQRNSLTYSWSSRVLRGGSWDVSAAIAPALRGPLQRQRLRSVGPFQQPLRVSCCPPGFRELGFVLLVFYPFLRGTGQSPVENIFRKEPNQSAPLKTS